MDSVYVISYQMHTGVFRPSRAIPSTQNDGFLLIFDNCTKAEGIGGKRRSISLEGNCWENAMGNIKNAGQVTPLGFML